MSAYRVIHLGQQTAVSSSRDVAMSYIIRQAKTTGNDPGDYEILDDSDDQS